MGIGLIIGLIIGLGLGYVISPLGVDTTDFEQQISDLENQVANLQEQVDDGNAQVTNLQTQIATLQSQLAELGQQMENKDNQIINLEQTREALESQISNLEQQLEIEVLGIHFSPRGGCEDQILYWIDRANTSIHILIYSFTLDSIGDALVEAHNRGIEVEVVFEKSQISQYSEYQELRETGIMVRNDTNSKFMHNKILIVDGIVVLTGSFNWSENAESNNNENLIAIRSTYVATIYLEEFSKIWSESQPATANGDQLPTEINIVISQVHPDAEGNDWYNLNDEYIVIWNKGTTDVDMTGWLLEDEANHKFFFPSFTLEAGDKVTVYTGSGTDTNDSLYWGSGSPIWNNDHDTAYLYNKDTELMDYYTW